MGGVKEEKECFRRPGQEGKMRAKEMVDGISQEILELSQRLKGSPVVHGNRKSSCIVEAMSKRSTAAAGTAASATASASSSGSSSSSGTRQTGSETFSIEGSNPYLSLRELHSSKACGASEQPVGHGLNANFRETGIGPRTSRVFNVPSLPCIAAGSYCSEGSVSASASVHGGNASDLSSDFFNSSQVTSTSVDQKREGLAGRKKREEQEAVLARRGGHGSPRQRRSGLAPKPLLQYQHPQRKEVVDSGWLCGCRPTQAGRAPYPYKEEGSKAGAAPPSKAGFGSLFRKKSSSSSGKGLASAPAPVPGLAPWDPDSACPCSFRKEESSAAVEAEFRRMTAEHEARMLRMQANVEEMMRTISTQLQQLEMRTSVSMDTEQMRRFWATAQHGEGEGEESPVEPPSLLEWQLSPRPTVGGGAGAGAGPGEEAVAMALDRSTREARHALRAFTERLVQEEDVASVVEIVSQLLPRVRFLKPSHACYGLQSCIAGAFFSDFDEPLPGPGATASAASARDCWQVYERAQAASPRDMISERHPDADAGFHGFCQGKLKVFQEEARWVSQWSVELLDAFLEAAMAVWRLRWLALALHPPATLIHASQMEEFSGHYMELVDPELELEIDRMTLPASVEFTVMPGFHTRLGFVKCQVYLHLRAPPARSAHHSHHRHMTL